MLLGIYRQILLKRRRGQLTSLHPKCLAAFRPTSVNLGGLLWKTPWKLSITRKANARARLKKVDAVIETVRASGIQCSALEKALQLPKEHEMDPKDKYTVFSATSRGYRKGIHKVPKWTRLTLRVNPKGF
ncbi:mitochondrial 54S ribosomal protein YmL31 [Suillus subalutaceus]|uniref:mitochondrial 54S ribosomal protein YmL31 n=1 Tax=Suillus subalutaceus TaxID=48586 RepID=UPI001B8618AA|nr:mitochondrial 54S ribosomal protein YmL31 [Suillus subalutaceus]KAG1877603.1 mitochondrial 54S ribosomal protein YmL31 [Suillus subalutaceus]